MSISLKDLTIRGRNGQRVPVEDCEFQPLNLLLPGAAPIVVPKKRAKAKITSPAADDNGAAVSNKASTSFGDNDDDDYAADADEEETQPLVKKGTKAKGKAKAKGGRVRSNSTIKERAVEEAKKRKKAKQHMQGAQEGHERLAARFVEQKKYIAQLNAQVNQGRKKVAPAESSKKNEKVAATTADKTNANKKKSLKKGRYVTLPSSDDQDTTTDETNMTNTSGNVRNLLTNMRIRAAGRDTPDIPFTPSEDSQILVLKKAGETWATIATAMNRHRGEVTKRYKHLQSIGAKVPGEDDTEGDTAKSSDNVDAISSDVATAGDTTTDDEATDAEKVGEETTEADEKTAEESTDAEKTGEETTDAEKTGEDAADAEKSGEETTDAEKTGDETTSAEKTDHENEDEGFLGEVPFGTNLFAVAETAAAETVQEPKKGTPQAGGEQIGKKQKRNKLRKNQPAPSTQKPLSPPLDSDKAALIKEVLSGGDAGYNASVSEDVDETGTRAYIGQYGGQIIADHCAGRVRMPEPDHHFNTDDCVMLALVERRCRTNRWLEIQAEFANSTGRLIPEEVLKWKLGEGEKPEDY